MNKNLIIILVGFLFLASCAKETENTGFPQERSVTVNLQVKSAPVNDPMSVNQDQTFGSLAIYLYNHDASFTLEQSALLSSFSPMTAKEIPIQTQAGTKILYLIANYTGKTFKLSDGTPLTLTPTTTKQQLDNMIVESRSGFSPEALLMIGKQVMIFTPADNNSFIEVALRRMEARVDVHVYKGTNFGQNTVTLQSVTFHNQVLNSEVKFDYAVNTAQMLPSPMLSDSQVLRNDILTSYSSGTVLQPSASQAVFYSYQNLVTVFSPVQVTAPFLEIKVNAGGAVYTYNGYITDNNQLANKYSLLQNNLYQITAIVDIAPQIVLNVNVLPWSRMSMEYGRPITANDFSFGPWGTSWGGTNGKTMNTNGGNPEDAVFQFELKAPIGAAWTATLTNGLDFAFTSATAGTSATAVSKGFTNVGSFAIIAVRASKRWTGDSRDTDFYITVEGNEIPINPVIGTARRYEGTDTRIKIKQVASYN
ncbi:MAG: hypothetical protein RR555_01640 [Bacteroidales bacterium]